MDIIIRKKIDVVLKDQLIWINNQYKRIYTFMILIAVMGISSILLGSTSGNVTSFWNAGTCVGFGFLLADFLFARSILKGRWKLTRENKKKAGLFSMYGDDVEFQLTDSAISMRTSLTRSEYSWLYISHYTVDKTYIAFHLSGSSASVIAIHHSDLSPQQAEELYAFMKSHLGRLHN